LSVAGGETDDGSNVSGSGSWTDTTPTTTNGWFFFDVPGEYRVVTTNITGDYCLDTCTDEVEFYIEYGDGYYNTACTVAPCIPSN